MLQYIHASTTDLDIQNLDSAVSRVFDSLIPNPLLNNPTLIENLIFTANTDLYVTTRLGRAPKGYILVSSTAAACLFTSPTQNSTPAAFTILQTDADTTASILFF